MAENLYVISHSFSSLLVKIGISKCWENRKKQLKVGIATRLEVLVECSNMLSAEKQCHQKYRAFRVPQSEWFFLPDQATKDALLNYAKLQGIAVPQLLRKNNLCQILNAEDQENLDIALQDWEQDFKCDESCDSIYMAMEDNPFIIGHEVYTDDFFITWTDGREIQCSCPRCYIEYFDPNGNRCYAMVTPSDYHNASDKQYPSWMFKTEVYTCEYDGDDIWQACWFYKTFGSVDGMTFERFMERISILEAIPPEKWPVAVHANRQLRKERLEDLMAKIAKNG